MLVNKYSLFASLMDVAVLNGLTLNPLLAQQAYQPLTVTGFNEDLIANGSGSTEILSNVVYGNLSAS